MTCGAVAGQALSTKLAPCFFAGLWLNNVETLVPSGGEVNSGFGVSVAMGEESSLLVGAHRATTSAGSEAGKVYVYSLDSGSWSEAATITASQAAAGEHFGVALARQVGPLRFGLSSS